MKKIVNNIWIMVYLIIIFSSVLFNQIFAVNELVISFCISIITGCFVALFSSYNDYCIEKNNLTDEVVNKAFSYYLFLNDLKEDFAGGLNQEFDGKKMILKDFTSKIKRKLNDFNYSTSIKFISYIFNTKKNKNKILKIKNIFYEISGVNIFTKLSNVFIYKDGIDEFLNNRNFEECISLINNEILQINSEMLNIDKEYTEIWNDLMEKAKEWIING